MAQNVKTLKLDKIEQFLLKNMQFTPKSENIYRYCHLRLTQQTKYGNKIKKIIHQHSFFAIFLSKAKTKIMKKKRQNQKLVEKVVQMSKGAIRTHIFLRKVHFLTLTFRGELASSQPDPLTNAQQHQQITIWLCSNISDSPPYSFPTTLR